jgi:hypothetical protein
MTSFSSTICCGINLGCVLWRFPQTGLQQSRRRRCRHRSIRRGVFAGGRGWVWRPWFVLEWVLKPYRQTLAMRHSLGVGFWSWCVSAAYVLFLLTVPPLRRVTFGSCPKSNQKVLPLASGPTSSGSLAPSLLQGPAYKGRPWPFTPLAASMRLAPFHNDSTQPPEWGVWCRL